MTTFRLLLCAVADHWGDSVVSVAGVQPGRNRSATSVPVLMCFAYRVSICRVPTEMHGSTALGNSNPQSASVGPGSFSTLDPARPKRNLKVRISTAERMLPLIKVLACMPAPRAPFFYSDPDEPQFVRMNAEEPGFDWLVACRQADCTRFRNQ